MQPIHLVNVFSWNWRPGRGQVLVSRTTIGVGSLSLVENLALANNATLNLTPNNCPWGPPQPPFRKPPISQDGFLIFSAHGPSGLYCANTILQCLTTSAKPPKTPRYSQHWSCQRPIHKPWVRITACARSTAEYRSWCRAWYAVRPGGHARYIRWRREL